MAKRKKLLHPSIKECLGYDPAISDDDFLDDWKQRSTQVCKPCWELKYCPYGPFVEQSPLLPPLRAHSVEHHNYLAGCLASGMIGMNGPLPDRIREIFEALLTLHKEDPSAAQTILAKRLSKEKAFSEAMSEGKSLTEIIGGELPPIHQYRAPFPFDEDESEDFKISPELQDAITNEFEKMRLALESGIYDDRKPLDPGRRSMFTAEIDAFDPETYPDHIPDVVSDLACNVFGHICPIVFAGENISETSDLRRRGRYIPFHIKMRVVRRDNYTCQECGKHLQDNEVEFDHIIPVAKGGSTEEHNIRLTCFDCNRGKSDNIDL